MNTEDETRDRLAAELDKELNAKPDNKLKQAMRAVDRGAARISATAILTQSSNLIGGDRDRQHGAKEDNFARIATVWNAWLAVRKSQDAPLDAHDVGCMMAMMKLARTQSGALNVDDYIDAAGYAACAGEVAQG